MPFLTVALDHSYCSLLLPGDLRTIPGDEPNATLAAGLDAARLMIEKSVCPATALKYRAAFQRWLDYSRRANVPGFPADSDHVAACLATLATETRSVSAVEAVYAAISHAHRSSNLPSPTASPAVALLMRSIRRQYQTVRSAATPLDADLLRQLMSHLYHPRHGLDGLRYSICLK